MAGPEEAQIQTDYRTRRGELSAFGRAYNSATSLTRIQILFIGLLLLAGLLALIGGSGWGRALAVLGSLLGIGAVLVTRAYTNLNFIEPDLAFRKWIQQVCDGDLESRIDLPESHRHYKELDFHTRNIALSLNRLSTDMEALVDSQTIRLEYQNRCLELLFRVTADVTGEVDRDRMYQTVCRHLCDWFGNARVAVAQVEAAQLVWLVVERSDKWSSAAVPRVQPGTDAPESLRVDSIAYNSNNSTNQFQVVLPVFDSGVLTSVIEINARDFAPVSRRELDRVLTTVSEQVSLYFAKQTAQLQLQQAQMVRDRNELAADIHDSLAQTLLAARYQASMLRESLNSEQAPAFPVISDAVSRIEGSIGAANQEVRGLIHEYRRPLAEHRYADSIEETIDRFRGASDLQVFFQTDDTLISFTPREESVVQRIIAEALVNAEKYSGGSMVRVYLQSESSGVRRVLIEDDGQGFDVEQVTHKAGGSTGEHIGLSIMHERALGIGAILTIESEPGEGTRVMLEIPPTSKFSGVKT